MARTKFPLWRGGFLAVLLAGFAGQPGLTQASVNIAIPNSSFNDTETGAYTGWTVVQGTPDTTGVSTHWSAGFAHCTPSSAVCDNRTTEFIDVSYLTVENKQHATMTLPYCAGSRSGSSSTWSTVYLYQYDGSGGTTFTTTGTFSNGDTSKIVHCSDGFAPDIVVAPIHPETEQLKVMVRGYSDLRAFASVGPINISVPFGAIGTGVDGGGSGGGGTLATLFTVGEGGVNQAAANVQSYINQACSSLSSISSAAGLVPDAWGGAGFGGQVAGILQRMRDLCEQELQTEIFGEVLAGITLPDVIPGTAGPITQNPMTAPTDTLDEYEDAISVHEGNADDLVTAQNRANEIAISTAKYQIAEMQKMRGASQTVYGYQSPRGPRVTAADIAATEPNMEFAEGDYAQSYERLNELVDEAELAPDMFRRAQDDGSTLAAAAGVCLLDPEPPTGDGWAFQADRAKWNIRQSIMSTEVGSLLCRIAEPEITAGPLCLSDTLTPLASVGMISAFMPTEICVEGPSAPDPIPLLFSMLGVLILLGGVMQAIGEFV